MNRLSLLNIPSTLSSLVLTLFIVMTTSLACTQDLSVRDEAIAKEADGLLTYYSGERKLLSFATEQILPSDTMEAYYARDGFIHPLYSPKGVVLTAGYPRGHVHQHGIFHAWTRTTVKGDTIDFWNQHRELGTVELRNHQLAGNQLNADLVYLAYVQGDTLEVADETWQVDVRNDSDEYNLLDIEIQHRVRIDSLHIQEYLYGGFGFRAAEAWNFEGTDGSPYDSLASVLTSLGDGHETSNHTRPSWITMWGDIDGDTAGVAIFSHPSNFRHPQPIRVHPTMPYFTFAPMVVGEFYLTPEEAYVARYRIMSFDGEPDVDLIRKIESEYGS